MPDIKVTSLKPFCPLNAHSKSISQVNLMSRPLCLYASSIGHKLFSANTAGVQTA